MEKVKTRENLIPDKRRYLLWIILILGSLLLIRVGVKLFNDRRYNLVSLLIVLLAMVPFYVFYERREGSIRRLVLVSAMTALAVVGRCCFMAIPAFNPVTAIVVLVGMYMGPESGFLVGSMTALLSNIFFGQGPWTPFQMFIWGMTGLLAGIPWMARQLRKKPVLIVYAGIAGVVYSLFMDIWTVLSLNEGMTLGNYWKVIGTAVPFTMTYTVANIVFSLLAMKPVGEKLQRIQIKHGIF